MTPLRFFSSKLALKPKEKKCCFRPLQITSPTRVPYFQRPHNTGFFFPSFFVFFSFLHHSTDSNFQMLQLEARFAQLPIDRNMARTTQLQYDTVPHKYRKDLEEQFSCLSITEKMRPLYQNVYRGEYNDLHSQFSRLSITEKMRPLYQNVHRGEYNDLQSQFSRLNITENKESWYHPLTLQLAHLRL